MKYILLLLLLLSVNVQISTAQQLAYKTRGTVTTMTGQRVSTSETKRLMASHPEALELFKKGKKKQTLGNIFILGGAGIAVGTFAIAYVSDSDFSPVTLVGAGIAIAGIPIKIGYSDKIKSAIKNYNSQIVYENANTVKPELTLCANTSGVGLKLTF